MDVHTRLMKKYKQVPNWWYHVILVANVALIIFACEYYNEALQLRYWGVLLACGIAIVFTLPVGVISATTNQVLISNCKNIKLPWLLFSKPQVHGQILCDILNSMIFCIFVGKQQPGLNIITEYVIGYLYPERPVANMCFKVYGYISMVQALSFLGDFKLGHYMKIPPRSMFMAQVTFVPSRSHSCIWKKSSLKKKN